MNYVASQANIIPVSNDTPTPLSNLKNAITSRTKYDTPFFLMPVRMETRFMKVMRNMLDELQVANTTTVLTGIKGTLTAIDKATTYTGFTSATAFKAADSLRLSVAQVLSDMQNIAGLQPVEREELNMQVAQLNQQLSPALAKLAQHCTDPQLSEQLQQGIIPEIGDALNQVGNSVQSLPEDNSWQDNVTDDGLWMANEVKTAISTCGSAIDQMFDGANFSQSSFLQFRTGIQNLSDSFKSEDRKYTPEDRQKVYGYMSQMQEVMDHANQVISEATATGIDMEMVPSDMYWLNQEVSADWGNFMMKDAAVISWLTAPEDGNSTQELSSPPDMLLQTAILIGDRMVTASDALAAFTLDDGTVQFNESAAALFINNVLDLGKVLDNQGSLDGSGQRQYIWQYLQPFNAQMDKMNALYNIFLQQSPPESLNGFIYKFRHVAYILSNSWDTLKNPGAAALGSVPNADLLLTDDEYNALPDYIRSTGDQVHNQANMLTDMSNAMRASGALPDQGNFTVFCDQVTMAGQLLSDMPIPEQVQENVQQRFLFQAVSPIVVAAGNMRNYVQTFQQSQQDMVAQFIGQLTNATGILTNAWGTAVKVTAVNAGTATLFSPWRLVDELWIRVYPDDIFIHSHEEALTQEEHDAGIAYWTEWWAAHGNTALQLAAWRALVALYGPQRAAWIIKCLTPTNLANVVVIGTATATMGNISILGSYTSQLQAISSNSAQLVAMPDLLSHYTPQLSYLSSSISKVQAIPADFAEATVTTLNAVRDGFNVLSDTLLSQNDGISESVYAIHSQFDQLQAAVQAVHIVSSWDEIYNEIPNFPTVTIKDANWTAAAKTYALPDRFVFATINDQSGGTYSFRHIKVGLDIPADLQVGMDPENTDFDIDAYNNLILDPQLKWMFDFNEAVNKGMGIIIRLTTAEATAGFDRLLALGVKLSDTTNALPAGYSNFEDYVRKNGKRVLEKLIDNHHYTSGGMGMLELGTPTNNTDSSSAGYNQPDDDNSLSFAVEAQNALFGITNSKLDKKDGQWLADALGIDYSVLQHIENSGRQQISGAISMNRALWPATIGNFMSEMLTRMFTRDNIQRTQGYFTDYVLGRNALPPLRIGDQPYGILPTTAFTRWAWQKKYSGSLYTSENDYSTEHFNTLLGANASAFYEDRFNERLLQVLGTLNNTWQEMVAKFVKTVDKNAGTASAQKDFMEILGSDALMSEAYSRFMLNASTFQNIGNYYNPGGISWAAPKIDVPNQILSMFNHLSLTGTATGPAFGILDDNNFTSLFSTTYGGSTTNFANGIMKALPILNLEILKADPAIPSPGDYLLAGPTVDEKVLSELDAITPIAGVNYIQWLLNATPSAIWNNNVFGTMQSRSLLFLLLRQSMLTTYRETCWDTMVKSNLFSKAARNAVGTVNGMAAQVLNRQDQLILTKWQPLFRTIADLASDTHINQALSYFTEDTTWWPSTATPPSVVNNGTTDPSFRNINLGLYLKNPASYAGQPGYSTLNANTDLSQLTSVRDAFTHLRFLPTADLDRMLREHIDLCTNRLDAWNSGMVNKRLWQHRNVDTGGVRKTGIYLGAYSWQIDIRPKNPAGMKKITPAHLPTHLNDSTDPVYFDPTNLGFVHTPSVAHSLTASILRSGFVSEQNAADKRFAVNLTSERVKMALSMLEGIRNGQTLNALLGYMFERGLHEGYAPTLPLDVYIYKFRRQFPLGGTVPTATLAEQVRPNNVVDGVELLHTFRSSITSYLEAYPDKSIYELYTTTAMASLHPFGLTGLPANGTAECTAIIKEIDRMANAADATGDLAIAEGVFQVAKGNFDRSSAVMESLTEGKNPTDPEIIDTPVSGTHLGHRMVAMIDPVTGTPSSPWADATATAIPMTDRAFAEPTVNNWAAQVLAAAFPALSSAAAFPTKVGCVVQFKDATGADKHIDITLAQLGLQPIDLIYLVHAGSFKEEMTKRIAAFARKNATGYGSSAGIPKDVQLTILLKNKGADATLLASFWDIQALVSAASGTILNSRWLQSEDFMQTPNPATGSGPLFNVNEIKVRANNYLSNFDTDVRTYFNTLTTTTTITTDPQLTALRDNLAAAAAYGIDFAVTDVVYETFLNTTSAAINDIATELVNLGLKVKTEVLKRYADASTLVTNGNTAAAAGKEEVAVKTFADALNAIFGNGFKALPHFSFSHYTGLKADVDNLLNPASASVGIMRQYQPGNVVTAMEDWLFSLGRVQEKLSDVETLRMMAADGSSHPLKTIRPVQFPYVAANTAVTPVITEDYWLGLPYPGTYEPSGDKVSVNIFNYGLLAVTSYGYYAGLVIDEWTELIPDKNIMSGIGFNYDQPNAKPPQTALLAVSPHVSGTWSLDDMWYTLLDTMEMSKIRMVEPDHFRVDPNDPATNKFEIFKWLLPAVVGEVTPHVINEQPTGTFNHVRYQSTDSIQQVSFEYNPVNDPVPVTGTVNSGILNPIAHQYANNVQIGINWEGVDADTLIGNADMQTFATAQYSLTNIAVIQGQMAAMQASTLYSNAGSTQSPPQQ